MKVVISDADREAVDRLVARMTDQDAERVLVEHSSQLLAIADDTRQQIEAERIRWRILNIVLPILGFILTALLGSWFVG